ncbi:MAG: CpsB/CapC family capsule biosynthesis tyrosine phosphatase [Bacteroidota bacterium]
MGLFSKKKKVEFGRISDNYLLDIHAHIIPHVDDGAVSFDESLKMIDFLMQNGIQKIIATPHISLDYPENTSQKIRAHFYKLKERLAVAHCNIELELAAEYMIDDGFRALFEKGELLTFGNKFLLVELSGFSQHPDFSSLLFDMQASGYRVVLAHPERYSFFHDKLTVYKELKDREVFFQLNVLSLTDIYSQVVHRTAKWLIENSMVDFIGSDIHNQSQLGFYKKAFAAKLFEKVITSNALKNNDFL